MSDLLPGKGTVGFVIPCSPDEPFLVKEWDYSGRLIRVQQRVLNPGERDPFSADQTGSDEERERLFWERTTKVADTMRPPPPKWVTRVGRVAILLDPAMWILVIYKHIKGEL